MIDKYHRQWDLIDFNKLNNINISIIGAGAIGSFCALTLAKMGAKNITIYDNDTIEELNLPLQFFRVKDIGKNKAEAIKEIIKEFENIEVSSIPEKFNGQELTEITISAVDSLEARRDIWEHVKFNPNVKLLIDGRMGGETLQVFSLSPFNSNQIEVYEKSIEGKGYPQRCTEKGILYTILEVSGLIAGKVKKYIQGQVIQDIVTRDSGTLFQEFGI